MLNLFVFLFGVALFFVAVFVTRRASRNNNNNNNNNNTTLTTSSLRSFVAAMMGVVLVHFTKALCTWLYGRQSGTSTMHTFVGIEHHGRW